MASLARLGAIARGGGGATDSGVERPGDGRLPKALQLETKALASKVQI